MIVVRGKGPDLDWLGLDRTDQQLERAAVALAFEAIPDEKKGPGTARRAAEPGLWRDNMSSLEQRTMHEVMGEKLRELGYEVEAPEHSSSGPG